MPPALPGKANGLAGGSEESVPRLETRPPSVAASDERPVFAQTIPTATDSVSDAPLTDMESTHSGGAPYVRNRRGDRWKGQK